MEVFDKAPILDYWRAIEIFSPQMVPRAAPHDRNYPVFTANPAHALPWNPAHALRSLWIPPKNTRRFVVYGGIFRLEKVRIILEETLGKDPESFDERSDGESCLFAFSATEDGRPLCDSFVLSSCAWATARTLSPGPTDPQWLVGFEKTAEKIAKDFAERYAVRPDDERGLEINANGFSVGRPLIHADLLELIAAVESELGAQTLYDNAEVRIKAGLVASLKKYSADDQDFLNSFYLKDLGKVADAIRKSNIGAGLSKFLSEDAQLAVSQRIDTRKSIGHLFQQLSPALFPNGRWPSNGHHPLVFSQQFAVNSMVQGLATSDGVFAVNGPPGTGKTTLLRDLIASIVVDRAKSLSDLSRPEAAFVDQKRWRVGRFTRVISTWKKELKGFEIVIASNNNGAVENVSLEIPGKDAVDPSWLDQSHYFSDFASRLIGQPAWALIAARLGNKANRNAFTGRFWYGSADEDSEDVSSDGFLSLLKSADAETVNWPDSVSRYKKALAEEQRLRAERQQTYATYLESFSLAKQVPALEKALAALRANVNSATTECERALQQEKSCAAHRDAEKTRRLEHRQFFPRFLEIIFSLGSVYRDWRRKDRVLEASLAEAEVACSDSRAVVAFQRQAIDAFQQEIQKAELGLEHTRSTLALVRKKLKEDQDRWGKFFPDMSQWRDAEPDRELSSPWSDPEWNHARAQVFLEALALHRAFILANADTMRKSLQGAMDVLSGSVPDSAAAEAVEAAWTSLFFVIPVISTTFASFDRLFSHLGREALGWLLIDEAGQAVPQAAAGAIWRAKRSVVVGDSLQLEPVVTLPFTVQQALRRHYAVAETWVPGTTSVQQLADRVSQFGTHVNVQEGAIWVGSPLRVHRRCDQPMFDISNKVAYDGLMVFGTVGRPNLDIPSSDWIHVESENSEGHWIPAEGAAVQRLIRTLVGQGIRPDQMFLISPFRVVVQQLRKIAEDIDGIKVGTIHTVQGKEADVVILVLGGNPQRPGAKQWASARPNLLNVAASRAKRRLYVVGNRHLWKSYPFFSVCSATMQRFSSNESRDKSWN